jgi:ADP-ribose pyrophosphatase YjhB (NUDIX family)
VKRSFELLVFSGAASNVTAQASTTDSASGTAIPVATSDTASGVHQGAKWQEREATLKALATSLRLPLLTEDSLQGPTEDTLCCDVEWPIYKIGRDSIILLAGSPTAEQLTAAVSTLKKHGHDVAIVVDAIKDLGGLLETLAHLNEQAVQMLATGAVKMLVTGDHLMVYRFPKADSTTTIAVFADIDSEDPLVLTMVRGANPFKDMESFPGGFLNVQLESLPECAARELMEECFVNPNKTGEHDRFTYHVAATDMVLIDVRSTPDRDERGHVVDHGYAYFTPKDKQAEMLSKLNAGDDAKEGSARFVRASELKGLELAFDHKKLFEAALLRLKSKQA